MHEKKLNIDELKDVLSVIGLSNEDGIQNLRRVKKHKEVTDYILHISKAVNSLSSKRTITIVDCACGRSYLSFFANYYLSTVLNKGVKFICIDYNSHVIEASEKVAKTLGFNNMTFLCDDILNVNIKDKVDIVCSLHACDTATDITIAKGISLGANYIFAVSCCQKTFRDKIKKHPLTSVTRHGAYKERIADMIVDSMRALALEYCGYKTKIFEYVPTSVTPKNIMIRAMRIGTPSNKNALKANKEYNKLKSIFNAEPKLLEYLRDYSYCKENLWVV